MNKYTILFMTKSKMPIGALGVFNSQDSAEVIARSRISNCFDHDPLKNATYLIIAYYG